MAISKRIKPIGFLKERTADAVREVTESGQPMFITQDGEAKVVVQAIEQWEETQETLAFLKILVLGEAETSSAATVPAKRTFEMIRSRLES